MHGMNYIGGEWKQGRGAAFASEEPATGEIIWRGHAADAADIDEAVAAAHAAAPQWAWRPFAERLGYLKTFQAITEAKKDALAETLARETGKTLWDAKTEIGALVAKLSFVEKAWHERTGESFGDGAGFRTALRHKPHGVLAVYGPYNFPAHLPNGHMMPALLAGNCVIFKPSELTPAVAEQVIGYWHEAGIPPGVVQLVQGERETGKRLSAHAGLDGLLFTGSSDTGKILHRQFADAPHKILALELGGNNPLVVHAVEDAKAAAYWTIQSAYFTSGQRCTCARRLIVPYGADNDRFLDTLASMTRTIRVGAWNETPEPYMGPLISNREADHILAAQDAFLKAGARALVTARRLHPTLPFISPSLLDVTEVANREDKEWFGPLLQIIRVADMDEAIAESNRTQYGLSSGIFTDSRAHYESFLKQVRAGVVNWNRPLTGSSATLPFGGVGLSGNHRPAAYYAADYCAYPVSSNEAERVALPASLAPGLSL